jgi:PTS system nitrogen regulatory IIA component
MVSMSGDVPLSTLIERGGIFYGLKGATVESVIAEFIRLLPGFEDFGDFENSEGPETPAQSGDSGFKAALFKAVLEREALMSTGIGQGVALPHPRNPLITDAGKQFVAVGFPAGPVDWKALDGKPVHTILLIVSASARFHLHTTSKINFLCHDGNFLSLLTARPSLEAIIRAVREAERGWQ